MYTTYDFRNLNRWIAQKDWYNAALELEQIEADESPELWLQIWIGIIHQDCLPLMEVMHRLSNPLNLKDSEDVSALLWVVAQGNHTTLRWLLEHGANPDFHCKAGYTPLQVACDQGDAEAVRLLLKYGAQLEHPRKMEPPPPISKNSSIEDELLDFMESGMSEDTSDSELDSFFEDLSTIDDLEVEELCSEESFNPHLFLKTLFFKHYNLSPFISKGLEKKQPYLLLASGKGAVEVMNLLLEAGVEVNQQDYETGETALHTAVSCRQKNAVDFLLQHNIQILENRRGESALRGALQAFDFEMVQTLLNYRPLSEWQRNPSKKVFSVLAENWMYPPNQEFSEEKLLQNNLRILDLLRSSVDTPNETEILNELMLKTIKNGSSKISEAGKLTLLQALIQRGASPDAIDVSGNSALLSALQYHNWGIARFLIETGVSLNVQNKWGQTALMDTARTGNIEILRLLLERGADPKMKDSTGLSVLYFLNYRTVSPEVVTLLLNKGAEVNLSTPYGRTVLQLAATEGHEEAVTLLLAAGASLDTWDYQGNTALSLALLHHHPGTAQKLIFAGARHTAWSALAWATLQGDLQGLDSLYRQKVSLDTPGSNGKTALMLAVEAQQFTSLEWLLQHGANPNLTNEDGWSAFMFSVKPHKNPLRELREELESRISENLHTGILDCLLRYGAQINLKNKRGETALDLSRNLWKPWLIRHGALAGNKKMKGVLTQEEVDSLLRGVTGTDSRKTREQSQTHRKILSQSEIDLFFEGNVDWREKIKIEDDFESFEDLDDVDWEELKDIKKKDFIAGDLYINRVPREKRREFFVDNDSVVPPQKSLIHAVLEGDWAKAHYLLNGVANLNEQSLYEGRSALMEAARLGHNDLLGLLLQRGANPNLQDFQGMNALMWAVASGNMEGIRLLLTLKDSLSGTLLRALDLTIQDYWGGDLWQKDNLGRTALDLAQLQHNPEVTRLLETVMGPAQPPQGKQQNQEPETEESFAKWLASVPPAWFKSFLATIEETNPELAENVRERIFTFDDLVLLEVSVLTPILGAVSWKDIFCVLPYSGTSVQELIIACLAQMPFEEAFREYQENLQITPQCEEPPQAVYQAQSRILKKMVEFLKLGKISLPLIFNFIPEIHPQMG
ncbi:MAG: ankyrin repeat domain-containing protein [SAR324 cluster bacterium]|nr:ankyrin repeat domain-containing protein [SAR324 cluster bacterium]